MNGYFRDGSNDGGLTIQPWILRPSKLGYQISSGSGSESWPNNSSLNVVSFFVPAPAAVSTTCRSPTTVGDDRTSASFCPVASAVYDMTSCAPRVTTSTRPFVASSRSRFVSPCCPAVTRRERPSRLQTGADGC